MLKIQQSLSKSHKASQQPIKMRSTRDQMTILSFE